MKRFFRSGTCNPPDIRTVQVCSVETAVALEAEAFVVGRERDLSFYLIENFSRSATENRNLKQHVTLVVENIVAIARKNRESDGAATRGDERRLASRRELTNDDCCSVSAFLR